MTSSGFANADGSPISAVDFEVDLGELATATTRVANNATNIKADMASIKGEFATVVGMWQSPSGDSAAALLQAFTSVQADLSNLLDDAVSRMRDTHDSYLAALQANLQVLS